jgi:hypothetical protein
MQTNQRIIVYIDGFNFYYGLKQGWRKYYWLDIFLLFKQFITEQQEIVCLKYFTARPLDPHKRSRQKKLFDVNSDNSYFELIYGKYTRKKNRCFICKKELICHHCATKFKNWEEKKTDVNISVHLLGDVFENKCDHSILVSADSDLIAPINYILNNFPDHNFSVFFPPNRTCTEIYGIVKNTLDLTKYKNRFQKAILPADVVLKSGQIISKPPEWK